MFYECELTASVFQRAAEIFKILKSGFNKGMSEAKHEASEVRGGKIKKLMLDKTFISVQWGNVKTSERNQGFSSV